MKDNGNWLKWRPLQGWGPPSGISGTGDHENNRNRRRRRKTAFGRWADRHPAIVTIFGGAVIVCACGMFGILLAMAM